MKERFARTAHAALLAAVEDAFECPSMARLPDKAVHAIRKSVKKGRAALRLLRPAMTDTDYHAEDIVLQERGRSLAHVRDARSLLDAFDAFAERHARALRGVGLERLRRWLMAGRTRARRELAQAPDPARACTDGLEAFRATARRADLLHADPATTLEGLHRIYRKGRKRLAKAQQAQTTQALHAWRKQVKHLLNATQALRRAGMRPSRKMARRADRIAGLLGDDHDLAMLNDAIRDSGIDADAVRIFDHLIARRRAKLQSRAFGRGRTLYAMKPKRFSARLDFG